MVSTKRTNKEEVLRLIDEERLIAVVRVDHADDIYPTVDALVSGGIKVIELTMTIPNVLDYIPSLVKHSRDEYIIGVGSVLTSETATMVAETGAHFIVSPVTNTEIIETAHRNDLVVSIGAYSPTEILHAWNSGSNLVKVFPADTLGPSYIKGIKAVMPFLKLLPTGGITSRNAESWLQAGSHALGAGNSLVDKSAIRNKRFHDIKKNAEAFVQAVKTSIN